MKILLAVDGSPFSKRMLAYLSTHEALLNGSNDYTVVTAQPALPPRARAAVGKEIVDRYYSDESEKCWLPSPSSCCAMALTPNRSGKWARLARRLPKWRRMASSTWLSWDPMDMEPLSIS